MYYKYSKPANLVSIGRNYIYENALSLSVENALMLRILIFSLLRSSERNTWFAVVA